MCHSSKIIAYPTYYNMYTKKMFVFISFQNLYLKIFQTNFKANNLLSKTFYNLRVVKKKENSSEI